MNIKYIYRIILVLLLPALLINLGLVAYINDEGIRALVALEMELSGNYLVPTMHGELYLNKPPLYNWIILLFFKFFGEASEWTSRLPTVFFLCCYAGTVYFFSRKYFSQRFAFINALALVTCGRILFYDSFLGLIDICFSWVIFMVFMLAFHFGQQRRWTTLFVSVYTLSSLAFLMKGLPALVFLGSVLLAYFIWQRDFKRLFSVSHILGFGIMLVLLGSYYYAYAQEGNLADIIATLFNESAKRTAIHYDWVDTLIHLFTFPFEMIYHFLPWSILVVYIFRKEWLSSIRQHPFIAFNALAFAATIPVYWASVEVYPRYLFMHVPLLFTVFLYWTIEEKRQALWQDKWLDLLWRMLPALAVAGMLFLPFVIEGIREQSFFYFKWIGLLLMLGAAAWLLGRVRQGSTEG